jgi:phage shock protein PspC (stress-responsive transcriptional regulator)
VRPLHGRYLAGVCAGVARATNTDPMLWRVLAAVLTLFGGIGLLLYLIGWLLIPAEGDTASPLESLVGRGDSNTSALTVVVVTVLAVLVFVFIISDGFRVAVLGIVAVIAALLLFQRGGATRGLFGSAAPPQPPAGQPDPGSPPPAYTPPPGFPSHPGATPHPPSPAYPASTSYPASTPYPQAAPYPPPYNPYTPASAPTYPWPGTAYPARATTTPTTTTPLPPSGPPAPPVAPRDFPGPGYRPPFAPHGPYASAPPGKPPKPPKRPKPPKERSRLGRIVLSLLCLALGAVALADMAYGDVMVSTYFAAALAVVGVGLLVGAWLGRARLLIVLGVLLTGGLAISTAAESDGLRGYQPNGYVLWQPMSMAELNAAYSQNLGDATLDLRNVDFTTATTPVSIDVSVDTFGNLRILLPENVDIDLTARVSVGDADVLTEHWGGLGTPVRRIQDNGADGPGGGKLVLDARVGGPGNLEVTR